VLKWFRKTDNKQSTSDNHHVVEKPESEFIVEAEKTSSWQKLIW